MNRTKGYGTGSCYNGKGECGGWGRISPMRWRGFGKGEKNDS